LSPSTENPLWYALAVRPRHEKSVARDLRLRGLEECSPTYRSRRSWSDRLKWVDLPLFPGYVFCRFARRFRYQALSAPGVISIVGFGGADQPVEESQMEAVLGLAAAGVPLEPWSYLRAGDAVRIGRGALAGVQGILLREKGVLRVVVNIDLLQRAVAVELDRDVLTPLSAGWLETLAVR
jgi:transcription termination/antitermination protein NusG